MSYPHLTVAQKEAVWIDRSDWSVMIATGSDRIDLLNRISTNDLRQLKAGSGMQTVLITDKARILDVLTLIETDLSTIIVGSPDMASPVMSWIKKYTIMDDVKIKDVSDTWDCIEITGPLAGQVIQGMFTIDVSTLSMFSWIPLSEDEHGKPTMIVVRMQSMAELSYWVCGINTETAHVRDILRASNDVLPELQANDVELLRIISGMGKIGNEWTDAYNPLEAGLLHLTSFTKGCYIGQEVIARLDSYNKVKYRLMGVTSLTPFSRQDVLHAENTNIGVVSSSMAMDNGMHIGLVYIRGEHAHPKSTVDVISDGASSSVVLESLPMQWQ